MKFIDIAGYTFCLRLKKNIKVFIFDKKEGHKGWKWLDDISNYEWHSVCYDDILLTDDKYSYKLVYSKRHDTNDPWIIATNCDYKHTIINYGYRFDGIETHKKYKKKGKIRVMSLFQTGLTLFKQAINSFKYIRIPFRFILYDICFYHFYF